jgi:predicted phage tail protein
MSLSERATLVLAVTATVHGRSVTRGTLVRASAGPGAAKVAFSGRLGATALAPGSYRLTVTAIDGSGNRSKPVSTRFSIIKAPRR